jgi:hypothetical protein
VTNTRTYKRKTARGTMHLEMYMEAAKEIMTKILNLWKKSDNYSEKYMALQIFYKKLEQGR